MCVGSPKPVLPPRLGVLGMEGRQAWNGLKERKEEEGGREGGRGFFQNPFPSSRPTSFFIRRRDTDEAMQGGIGGKGMCPVLYYGVPYARTRTSRLTSPSPGI